MDLLSALGVMARVVETGAFSAVARERDLSQAAIADELLQEAERRGKHTRLEPVSLDGFAQLYAFPRWLAAVREGLPAGFPMPNLADIIQEKCEKLLEQVCMPVQE